METVSPPTHFFGKLQSQEPPSTPTENIKKSKFKPMKAFKMSSSTSNQKIDSNNENDTLDIFIYEGRKIDYVYEERLPDLDFSQTKHKDSTYIKRKIIEERNAAEQNADLFGVPVKAVKEIKEYDSIEDFILSLKTKNISFDKTKNSKKSSSNTNSLTMNIKDFFDGLFDLFGDFNDEERGKIILTMIFGGLMFKSKFSSLSKLPDRCTEIVEKIKNNGSPNNAESKSYLELKSLILSNKFNDYRTTESSKIQVNNVADFISRVYACKEYKVYIPNNFQVYDPWSKSLICTIVKNIITKNLSDYFIVQKQVIKKVQSKKIDDDDEAAAFNAAAFEADLEDRTLR